MWYTWVKYQFISENCCLYIRIQRSVDSVEMLRGYNTRTLESLNPYLILKEKKSQYLMEALNV